MMQITIKPVTYLYFVVLLFLVPLQWLAAWVIAVVFHEICHWAAVRICGGDMYSLTLGLGSANMECSMLSDRRRLLCVLSGPLGGFLLVLLGAYLPRVAICSWILSVYNLLPILPLDGGHALQILVGQDRIYYRIERIILLLLTFAGAVFAFTTKFTVLTLFILIILWFRNRKRPCKAAVFKVE